MKKNGRQGIIVGMKRILLLSCWLPLLLSACGLDTFYYLDPPVSRHFIDEADSSSQDPSNHYVSFVTASNADSGDVFQGTAVYYRLYNSASSLLSHKVSIESINDDSSDQGMNRLIGWGYQALTTSASTAANLVPSGGAKEVSMRLFNETPTSAGGSTTYQYPAGASVDGRSIGIPLRCFDSKTFSFSSTASQDEVNSVPLEGQEDVSFTASAGTSTWYVALYAVSTGMSPSLTPVYSKVTYLGSLAITPTSN